MAKYKIGEKYLINVFLEPEEMEYLGEIKNTQYNGCQGVIQFDVFRRYSYGRPDLIALYNGEFFTRSHDNTVEGFSKSMGNIFRFNGKGYTYISVGKISLSIEEFRNQVSGLLNEEQIEKVILNGSYCTHHNNGEIKWCPRCEKIRQTTCCACGCGNCESCGYRWVCMPISTSIIGSIQYMNMFQ